MSNRFLRAGPGVTVSMFLAIITLSGIPGNADTVMTGSLGKPQATSPDSDMPPAKRKHARSPAPVSVVRTTPYQLDAGVASWYHERGASDPTSNHPVYCHGYGCEFQTAIVIDDAALAALRTIFAGHDKSAADERKAISEAVRWWERRASPLLGGPPRKHGSNIADAHHFGSTDCIDEATNSTTILVVLEAHGLLKYHTVMRPESRGFVFNAHSTAIVHETGGQDWAVDMWMHDMGEAPDIMPETQWMSEA